ncbi:LamG-like jellyroll fold domain-containing protein, partial [Flavobacterium sp. RHBU_24]|uniref:Ig-like domain-containing protein n=1 Tax=Flavobacterium sp. RHBU_24 TaxID=3391185 RepID=UPI003984B0AB
QAFCNSATVANLTATGSNVQWYDVSTGGTSLVSTTALATGTYYVSQTLNSCESARTAVSVTINTPAAPTASAQSYPYGSTVTSLVATGTNLQWYTVSTGGSVLPANTALTATTYYVSQTVNGCESSRTAVSVTITYPIRYVKPSASGTGDGTSWANASGNLQSMINAASVEQVWVAAGVYYPTGSGYTMKNNVAIYGGFAGNETALSQRNWATNVTTLHGNNQRRVIYNSFASTTPLTATAVLDGFTITGGYNTSNGAGVYNVNASPTLTNLIISGNNSDSSGGGMYNNNSSPALTNTAISTNTAVSNGGGICNTSSSSPTITDVTITDNTANNGGGMYSNGSSPALTNVTITGNTAAAAGGGVCNSSAPAIITNAIISGNSAANGGAVYNNASATTTTNTLMAGNTVSATGGGVYNVGTSTTTLINVTISGNGGYGIYSNGSGNIPVLRNTIVYGNANGVFSGTPTYNNSLVQGITATTNGNINGSTNPMFVNAPSYTGAPFTGGDYSLLTCSPVLNTGDNSYVPSGITTDLAGNARIYNTTADMGAYELQQLPSTPAAPTASPQNFCNSATVASLVATGSNLQWYTASTGGSALASATALATGTYYVSQTLNGCESTRTAVAVTVNSNTAPTATTNSTGNALYFDGANDYVQTTDFSPVTINGSYTVEAWVKPENTSGVLTILSTRNGEYAFDFKLQGGNQIHGDIGNGISWITTTADAAFTYTANQWLHIAYVVTPTGYTIYANGQLVNTGTYSGTPLFIDSTRKLMIGAGSATSELFAGSIDEVKVYNTALTQAQVQTDMVSTTAVLPGNIKFYYTFNSGTANGSNSGVTTLYDQTSNAFNGALNNFALSGDTSNWIVSNAIGTQTLCNGATVADLTATGNALKWYTSSTGGPALASATALATGTYYVSQTLNGCESTRALVAVTINTTTPPTASAQTFCNGATVANLTATGTALKWYNVASGGLALA